MSFRLVTSGGSVTDPAVVNLAASGVVHNGDGVEWLRNGTGGAVVGPVSTSTTSTMIFGVALDYAQGASDTFVKVIPFTRAQLWEVDCANAASTAQLGFRHAIGSSPGVVHNLLSDAGAAAAVASRMTAVFLALQMTGSTSGSGKLIGRFLVDDGPIAAGTQT